MRPRSKSPHALLLSSLSFALLPSVLYAVSALELEKVEARLECERNNPKGCYNLGLALMREDKHSESLVPFRKACELKEPLGCLGLAKAWEREARMHSEPKAWIRVWVWSHLAREMKVSHVDAERLEKDAARRLNGTQLREAMALFNQAREQINPNPADLLGPLPQKQKFDPARVVEIPVPVASAPASAPSEPVETLPAPPLGDDEAVDSFLEE